MKKMTGLEICLILIGIVVIAASYIFSEQLQENERKRNTLTEQDTKEITEETVRQQVEMAVMDMIDETVEKTEARLDKISNEKIMAISGYSDNVMEEIHKNHDEVLFLYNMLTDKEKAIKNTVQDVEAVKQTVKKMAANTIPVSQSMPQSAPMPAKQVKQPRQNPMSGPAPAPKRKEPMPTKGEQNGRQVSAPKKAENMDNLNNNEKILALHKRGMTIIEIAKTLGLGMGEVRLVIDLFEANRNKG